MARLLADLRGHEGRVWHIAWSPDGTKIASSGEDKTVQVWTINPQNLSLCNLCILTEKQSRTIRSCEWSPSGREIACGSFDGTVIVWSAVNRSCSKWEAAPALEGHDSEVKSISWNTEGKLLASSGRDKRIWVWELLGKHEFECQSVLDGHSQDVKFVLFHPSSEDVLFSASYDDTIKIWTQDDGDWYCLSTLLGHSSTVWGLACNSEGDALVSCSADKSIILWQCESSRDPRKPWNKVSTSRAVHDSPIYSISWQPMANLLLTGGGDNAIQCLKCTLADDNFYTLELLWTKSKAHEGDVNCVRWNPSLNPQLEGIFLSAGDDGLIKLWALDGL